MIKLFIQGRKDGYKVLYPKPTPSEFFQFAGDLRPDSNNNQLLGKSFFSLAYSPGGFIFTKQLIIQDVQRQGLGNIGFSLFISAQKKIAGEHMIQLLDELVKTYALNYCPDYYLDFVQEDWTIFEKIVTKYSSNLQVNVEDDQENHQPGAEDPAYLYYSDKLELARFFDAPVQEEYAQFKQVFFIDKSAENQPYNPLKAIRHNLNGNLTCKIDLNNLSYKVLYNTHSSGGVRLDVQVNGKSLFNKSKIKRNDQLEITWSKPYQETRVKKGTCVEIGSTYLLINEDSRTITIKDIALNERMFKFQVKAQDKFFRPILEAELIAYSQINKRERTLVNNSIILKEEELNENYYVFGKKGNLVSEPKALTKMAANEEITLTLLETVKLTIKPLDNRNSNYLPDAKITIVDKANSATGHSADFRGDEVNKNWKITISHPEYRTETITYCPATDTNEKVVQLEKLLPTEVKSQPQQERKSYRLVIDPKKGMGTWNGKDLDLSGREFQKEDPRCDARYGYKFSGWEKVGTKEQVEIYEAIFDDLWYRKIPKSVLVLFPLLLVAGILFMFKDYIIKPEISKEAKEIKAYLEGNDLKLDSLLLLEKHCKNPKFSGENNVLCASLASAIAFRKELNQGSPRLLVKNWENEKIPTNQKKIIESLKFLINSNNDSIKSSLKDSSSWMVEFENLNLDVILARLDFIKNKSTGDQEPTDNGGPNAVVEPIKEEIGAVVAEPRTGAETQDPKLNDPAKSSTVNNDQFVKEFDYLYNKRVEIPKSWKNLKITEGYDKSSDKTRKKIIDLISTGNTDIFELFKELMRQGKDLNTIKIELEKKFADLK